MRQAQGSDPAAVAFDAIESALAKDVDFLIIDTAGRLHTQENLMKELEKIKRVIKKRIPDAPHETLLVLDATTGQNAISQAQEFGKILEITGIFLTKLDGTAKGGAVIGIRDQVGIPIKFIGVGEKMQDIEDFDPDAFVDALFEQPAGVFPDDNVLSDAGAWLLVIAIALVPLFWLPGLPYRVRGAAPRARPGRHRADRGAPARPQLGPAELRARPGPCVLVIVAAGLVPHLRGTFDSTRRGGRSGPSPRSSC